MDYWTLKKKAIIGSMQSGRLAEAEGYPLKLENAIKGNMKAYKIWGNKKGKNLLSYPFLHNPGIVNGITFTDNGDGSVTVNGTAEADVSFIFRAYVFQGTYTLSGGFGGSKTTYYLGLGSSDYADVGNGVTRTYETQTTNNVFLRIVSGYTANNLIIKPQLEEGTEATEYEPYQENDGLGAFSGNIDVVNSGKNLLKATDFYSRCGKDYSELMEDGRNCVRFTGSIGSKYELLTFKENIQYTISFDYKTTIKNTDKTGGSIIFRFIYADGSNDSIAVKRDVDWQHIKYTSNIDKTIADIGLSTYNYANWMYIDVDSFQLEEGNNATFYEPYIEPITTTINLTGHNSIMPNDYIDFKNQVIVRNDGTEEDIILPKIPLSKGYNILTASDAELEATKMYGKYLKKG